MTRSWAQLSLLSLLHACSLSAAHAEGDSWINRLGLRPGLPIVALPLAAGAMVGITETRKLDRYTQTVVLRGDPGVIGQNMVTATVTRDGLAPRIDQADVDAEMAELLPGIPMELAPTPGRNSLGVFGYALGHRGAMACIYGWQAVNLADRWISGDDPGPFSERHALSLRLRLCRQGATNADLARLALGLEGTTSASAMSAAAAGLVTNGGEYDALSAAGAADGLVEQGPGAAALRAPHAKMPRPRKRPNRRVRSAPPAITTLAAPMAGMPTVPPPE